MTRIDQTIADALAGSPETHVAILAREVVRLREARAVVAPDLTDEQLRAMLANAAHRCGFVDYEPEDASVGDLEILREVRDDIASLFRAIPADRVLGDGMVAVDREEWMAINEFADKIVPIRDNLSGISWVGKLSDVFEAYDQWYAIRIAAGVALRANQGGANHD